MAAAASWSKLSALDALVSSSFYRDMVWALLLTGLKEKSTRRLCTQTKAKEG